MQNKKNSSKVGYIVTGAIAAVLAVALVIPVLFNAHNKTDDPDPTKEPTETVQTLPEEEQPSEDATVLDTTHKIEHEFSSEVAALHYEVLEDKTLIYVPIVGETATDVKGIQSAFNLMTMPGNTFLRWKDAEISYVVERDGIQYLVAYNETDDGTMASSIRQLSEDERYEKAGEFTITEDGQLIYKNFYNSEETHNSAFKLTTIAGGNFDFVSWVDFDISYIIRAENGEETMIGYSESNDGSCASSMGPIR